MMKSVSYHEHLLEFLSDPEVSAAYLQDIIEDHEDEPKLLSLGLNNVAEALGKLSLSDEEIKEHQEKLQKILNSQGCDLIYELEEWLRILGLKLSVTVRDNPKNNQSNFKDNLEENNLIYSS